MMELLQGNLFDVEEYNLKSCQSCDYGEWHLHDLAYFEKGLKVLYPCRECEKCINYCRWIEKKQEVICEKKDQSNESDNAQTINHQREIIESDLFSIDECIKENKKIKEIEHQQKNLDARKKLTLKTYQNPQNENEWMFNLQYEYLKNNDEDSYRKLQEIASLVTERLVWKWMSLHSQRLSVEEQKEKTSIAVEYVLRRYKTRIGYCVTKNFITTLERGVEHAMLYKTKMDVETDYIEDIKGLII